MNLNYNYENIQILFMNRNYKISTGSYGVFLYSVQTSNAVVWVCKEVILSEITARLKMRKEKGK